MRSPGRHSVVSTAEPTEVSLPELIERARALQTPGRRRILGITGPPGAGKSSLAASLARALGPGVCLIPMDGFHLSNDRLRSLGLLDRKGAPETFDAIGYAALLRRLRSGHKTMLLAPSFDRTADQVVVDAIKVDPGVQLVITEGNYLLLDDGPWAEVRPLLDEIWYLAADARRVARLIERHVDHGKSPEQAREWVYRSDEANARLIALTAPRADLIIDGLPPSMQRSDPSPEEADGSVAQSRATESESRSNG